MIFRLARYRPTTDARLEQIAGELATGRPVTLNRALFEPELETLYWALIDVGLTAEQADAALDSVVYDRGV